MWNQNSLAVQPLLASGPSLSVIPLTIILVEGSPVISSYFAPSHSSSTERNLDTVVTSDAVATNVVTIVQSSIPPGSSPASASGSIAEAPSDSMLAAASESISAPTLDSTPGSTTTTLYSSFLDKSISDAVPSTIRAGPDTSNAITGHFPPAVSTLQTGYTTPITPTFTLAQPSTTNVSSRSNISSSSSSSLDPTPAAINSSSTSSSTSSPNSSISSTSIPNPSPSSSSSSLPPLETPSLSTGHPPATQPSLSTTSFLTTDASNHTFAVELVVIETVATVLMTVDGRGSSTSAQSGKPQAATTPVAVDTSLSPFIAYPPQKSDVTASTFTPLSPLSAVTEFA